MVTPETVFPAVLGSHDSQGSGGGSEVKGFEGFRDWRACRYEPGAEFAVLRATWARVIQGSEGKSWFGEGNAGVVASARCAAGDGVEVEVRAGRASWVVVGVWGGGVEVGCCCWMVASSFRKRISVASSWARSWAFCVARSGWLSLCCSGGGMVLVVVGVGGEVEAAGGSEVGGFSLSLFEAIGGASGGCGWLGGCGWSVMLVSPGRSTSEKSLLSRIMEVSFGGLWTGGWVIFVVVGGGMVMKFGRGLVVVVKFDANRSRSSSIRRRGVKMADGCEGGCEGR